MMENPGMSLAKRGSRLTFRGRMGARQAWSLVLVLGLLATGWLGVWSGIASVQAAPLAQARPTGTLTIVGANGAKVYASPGGEVIGELPAGTVLTAVGRTADSLWIVVYNDAGTAGWVEVSQVVLFGIEALPVMVEGNAVTPAAPGATTEVLLPTPTSTPPSTPTPTPSPTPSPTPTPTATPIPTDTLVGRTVAAAVGGAGGVGAGGRGGGAPRLARAPGPLGGGLAPGTALTVWGRSADSTWLVVTAVGDKAGWVLTTSVVAFNLESLPVLDGSASVAAGTNSAAPAAVAPTTAPAAEPATVAPSASAPILAPQATVQASVPAAANGDATITATVLVTDSRLNIRGGPGTGFGIVDKAAPGDVLTVVGRDRTATWIEVVTPNVDDGFGWVAAKYVELSHPILGIPVSPRAATLTPTPAPQAGTSAASPAGLSGRLVFQAANGGTIYVYDLQTGSLVELTSGFDPAISPDSSTVAFTRMSGEDGLYLIGIDGRNERRIYRAGEPLRSPTWSPDGRYIGFVRVAGDYSCRDVGFGICLPNNPFLGDFPLDVRPEWGLSLVDTDGNQFRDLPALTSVQSPDWTEAGIVYQAINGIEITDDKPGATTRSVVQAPYYQDPDWQPGGDRIVFQSREGSHWEIFVVNTDGSGLAALTRPVTNLVDKLPDNVAPVWSPDGRWIIYLSNRDANNDAGDWRLWVMDADGGNQRPLPIDVPIEYSYMNEQVVSWGTPG